MSAIFWYFLRLGFTTVTPLTLRFWPAYVDLIRRLLEKAWRRRGLTILPGDGAFKANVYTLFKTQRLLPTQTCKQTKQLNERSNIVDKSRKEIQVSKIFRQR